MCKNIRLHLRFVEAKMGRPPKKLLIIIASVVLVLVVIIFMMRNGDADENEIYRTQGITKGLLLAQVNATGKLEPVMTVRVGTQVSGTVKALYVDYNDQVKKDQLLLILDEELFQAKVNHSKAVVESAAVKLGLAQLMIDRYKNLYTGKTATKEEMDKAEAERGMAKAALDQAQAQLDIENYNLRNARIISPVDGVVINKQVDVGQTVQASFQTPDLIEIAQDLKRMQIDASFAEADVGKIVPGMAADFMVDTFPQRKFTGTIRQVRLNPTTTQNVVTYHIIIDVENTNLALLPGMTAYVDIDLHREEDVLMVPNAALNFVPLKAGEQSTSKPESLDKEKQQLPGAVPEQKVKTGRVFVLEGENLKEVPLVLGTTNQRQTTILEGNLKPGDQVVVGENPGQVSRK